MVGHPKFNYDDKVTFMINNRIVTGYVYIIDKYGIFEDDSNVYYDIMAADEAMLYKHIREDNLKKVD